MGLAVGVLIKPAKHLTTLHTLTRLPSPIGYREAAPAAANTNHEWSMHCLRRWVDGAD